MKKNKKFYNFTEKQKRRDRSTTKSRMFSVPSWFRRGLNKKHAAKEKAYVRKLLAGYQVEPPCFKKDAGYLYW